MNAFDERKRIFNTYFIYFMCMSIFCVARIGIAANWFNSNNQNFETIYTIIVQLGLMICVPMGLYFLIQRPKGNKWQALKRDTGLKGIGMKVILISLLLGIIVFIINIAVSSVFSGLLQFIGYKNPFLSSGSMDSSVPAFFLQMLLVAILPAIGEEFLHRGLLLNGIKNIGAKKAIFISAILFGFLHFNINQVFYTFVLGIIIGFVAMVSRSIIPCMIIHFVNNALSVYLSFATANGWFLSGMYSWLTNAVSTGNKILVFTLCFVAVGVLLFLLIFLVVRIFRITTFDKVKKVMEGSFEGDMEKDMQYKMQKSTAWKEVIETSGFLNIKYEEMKSPIDLVLPGQKNVIKTSTRVNIFLYSSLILGFLITLFTFIWGIV